jgi:hypothetical protein
MWHILEKINTYGTLVGKPDEKKPRERPGHRQKDNTQINLMKTRHQSIDWIHVLRIKSSGELLQAW